MNKFFQDFKTFSVKGNAVDMAVGIIVGGAFGKVVSSIVNDIIMPPIGWLIGGVSFSNLKYQLPAMDLGLTELPPATINYGNFIQTLIDFLIIALCVFLLMKVVTRISKKEVPASPALSQPSTEEKLLTEIRDLLKKKQE